MHFLLFALCVSFEDSSQTVPLERAAEKGHRDTVDKLLKGKASINHQNKVRNQCLARDLYYITRLNGTCRASKRIINHHLEFQVKQMFR